MFRTYLSITNQANSCTAFHPQPLLSSKASESRNETQSRSRTSFICLLFHLTRAISFSLRNVRTHNFLLSERHPVAALRGALNLTCTLSFAGGNAPPIHLETSQRNQNNKIQAEGVSIHSLQTQSPSHIYWGPEVMIEQYYICIRLYFIL